MSLLAIDTSIGTSVALDPGKVTASGEQNEGTDTVYAGASGRIRELLHPDERGHTEVIGSLIAKLFAETGAAPRDVTGVVVGIGPGPFTGLRVGIAAAKAFATGLGVPLLPISGHEAAAYDMLSGGTVDVVRVLQDARRRELFVTEYAGLDEFGLPREHRASRLLARADYREEPGDYWPAAIPAATLLRLAALRLAQGRAFEPAQAKYLRSPDARPAAAVKRVSL